MRISTAQSPIPRARVGAALAFCLVVWGCRQGSRPCDDSLASDDFFFASCAEVACAGCGNGVYSLSGGGTADAAYCENQIAGGGWRLISARVRDEGTLFGEERCLSPAESCSGRLFDHEVCESGDGQILFSTVAGETWLAVSSSSLLHDFLTRRRELLPENFIDEPHFWDRLPEPLQVVGHSSNFEPLAIQVDILGILSGGMALRDTDGRIIVAFNQAPFDRVGGALYINSVNAGDREVGDVVEGGPGALFYRCQPGRRGSD